MLQPLGINADAEAVYVLLARTENASVGELARSSAGFDVVKLRTCWSRCATSAWPTRRSTGAGRRCR